MVEVEVAAKRRGARGARSARVRRRDMSFAGNGRGFVVVTVGS